MLTRQKCVIDCKEVVKWIDVPVEKVDILAFLDKRISYIESDFIHCKDSYFLDEIDSLRHVVLAFSDLDLLTSLEVKKYLHIYAEFLERYLELKR